MEAAPEKSRLEFYLSRLEANLPPGNAALPTLDETISSYSQNTELRGKVLELSQSDVVSRLYAAVLLWPVERAKAEEILTALLTDKTPLRVQRSVGHGAVEIPLGLLARDFLEHKSFHGENLSRIEALANWSAAIAVEKRRLAESFDENELPRYADVFEAREDAEQMQKLRLKIADLKNGSVAERFYAAAIVKEFDETGAQNILESLLDEPMEVGVLSGDIMMNLPASQVAADLLGLNTGKENSPEIQNPIARFFKWIGG
jgi:hypothetical protein